MTGQVPLVITVRGWDPTSTTATSEFDRVIELHRTSKATLGHLPFAAFEEAGRRNRLILGFVDGEVQGYVLYSTPRHHMIKLVHVCVSAHVRRCGLAKRMVELAIESNPDRSTIAAHCRSDYGVDEFWRSLDMTPSAQRPGRAAKGSILTVWSRRIGQFDLLEEALYTSSRPLAVLDSNVVLDLYTSDAVERHDRQESLGLVEDWVTDLLDLSVSPEVEVDVNKFHPVSERKRVQSSLSALVPVRRNRDMKSLAESLLTRMPQGVAAKDASLPNDAKHLADAILAGADYFVTRDQELLDATQDWIRSEHEIEVLRPVQLLQRLIPPAALSEFRSDLLESVGLSWSQVITLDHEVGETFLDNATNEKLTFFRKRLHAVLSKPASARLELLVDERGRHWALLGTEVNDGELTVSIARVGRGRLGATVAFQLVRYIRSLALARGLGSVVVKEPSLASVLTAALEADGFVDSPLGVNISQHPDDRLVSDLQTPEEVAGYERKNWPQVILDREVPLWIIPIQPTYARELIGYNDTLFQGREKQGLGLAREFVYFGAPKVKKWTLPARVLWYVTKDGRAKEASAVRGVVAHSRIVDYAVVGVEEAIEQYRVRGVLRGNEIRERAMKGEVLVLRFEDTQPLAAPIGRTNFEPLLRRHGVNPPLLTMRFAACGLFDDVMRMQPGFEER